MVRAAGRVRERRRRSERPLILIATRRSGGGHESLAPELVDVLLEAASERNWRLLSLNLTGNSLTGEQRPAGALVTLLPDDPMAQRMRGEGIAMVRLGRLPHPDDGLMPAVYPDHAEAGRMAARYLVQRGFRDLALVGHYSMHTREMIEEGYRQAAEEAGCRCHTHYFRNPGEEAGKSETSEEVFDRRARSLTRWLGGLPKPVGLLAMGDTFAGIVSAMCQRAGLSVPEDVALLSMGDNRESCELGPVPISAIQLSRAELGRVAVGLLEQLMAGQPVAPRTLVPPSRIITRRSTDIMAINHPIVARSVRFICDHLDHDLSVGEVAVAMKTPRYKLERLFRQYLQRGINEELRRARLERFCELLRSTDLTVDELAPQVGYRSSKRLHGVFRKAYGMTPRHYRLAALQPDAQSPSLANRTGP